MLVNPSFRFQNISSTASGWIGHLGSSQEKSESTHEKGSYLGFFMEFGEFWVFERFCNGDFLGWHQVISQNIRWYDSLLSNQSLLPLHLVASGCRLLSFGSTPHPVTVTTRIITFLVGVPNKPSFETVTGWRVDPRVSLKKGKLQFLNQLLTSHDHRMRCFEIEKILWNKQRVDTSKTCEEDLPLRFRHGQAGRRVWSSDPKNLFRHDWKDPELMAIVNRGPPPTYPPQK